MDAKGGTVPTVFVDETVTFTRQNYHQLYFHNESHHQDFRVVVVDLLTDVVSRDPG